MTEIAAFESGIDRKMASETVHATIRDLILSGKLQGGTVISQVKLSEELGVSRTPLREALRMLQEEGLVDAEPNRRTRVASFDAATMDTVYAVRLMLEALGMRLTLPRINASVLDQAEASLRDLEGLEADGGPTLGASWQRAHHAFHHFFISGAPHPLIDQIDSSAQRSERYIYQAAQAHFAEGSRSAVSDHRHILELAKRGDVQAAIETTATHRARTALMVLADLASTVEPVAIRAALATISNPHNDAVKGANRRLKR